MGLNWEMKPLLENQTHPFTGTGCGEGGEYGGCRSQAKKFNWKSELTRLLINVVQTCRRNYSFIDVAAFLFTFTV